MLARVGLELAPSGYQTENASSNPARANEFFVDVSTVKMKLNLFNKGDIDVRIHEICTRRNFVIYSIILSLLLEILRWEHKAIAKSNYAQQMYLFILYFFLRCICPRCLTT